MKNKLDEEMVMDLNRIAQQALNDGFQNWIKKHNLTETAGECTCPSISCSIDPCCPKHGLLRVTPDIPLHARVAKALEYICWTDRDGVWRSNLNGFIPEGVKYPLIPDYPNDLVAAMRALEEYEKKLKKPNGGCPTWPIMMLQDRYGGVYSGGKWVVSIGNMNESQIMDGVYGSDTDCMSFWDDPPIGIAAADTLPQAICEAIVAHAEQQ